jgi:exopolysaccharide biosynthesis polyprenyl glycosylphosphotransferase
MADSRARTGIGHTASIPDQPSIVKPALRKSVYFAPLVDLAAVLMIPVAASLLTQTHENLQRNLCFWALLAFSTIILAASHGGYRRRQVCMLHKQTRLVINCFLATALAMLSMALLLGHAHILVRRWTFADLALTPFVITYARARLVNHVIKRQDDRAIRGSIVVCYDRYPPDLDKALNKYLDTGRVLGVLYLSGAELFSSSPAWRQLPDQNALLKTLRDYEISDVVFVHHPKLDAGTPAVNQQLLSEILGYPARIWLAFDLGSNLPDFATSRPGSCRLVPVMSDELVSSENAVKRAIDLLGSIFLMIVLSPILVLSAGLVKASSPGPIVFRQTRTGAHGKRFTVYKFRTMVDEPQRAFAQATPNDPRVTRIGRLLRRTSFDELPQLVNVVSGEMSLVGPRPHAPETQVEGINFENAVKLYRLRHRVKPGITGLAQIRGQRGETREIGMLEQRLASDLEYIQSWSLWLDIAIMLQTVPAMIARKNAW